MLTSNLNNELTVNPQDKVIFTCVTTGPRSILLWESEEYIGTSLRLEVPYIRCDGQNIPSTKTNANATCLNVTQLAGGEVEIVSELTLFALADYPSATVVCGYNGFESVNITFQTIGKCVVVSITSSILLY